MALDSTQCPLIVMTETQCLVTDAQQVERRKQAGRELEVLLQHPTSALKYEAMARGSTPLLITATTPTL